MQLHDRILSRRIGQASHAWQHRPAETTWQSRLAGRFIKKRKRHEHRELNAEAKMKNPIAAVRNALGIRKRRRLLPRGPKPAPGSRIIHGNLRMEVVEGMSPELWLWLSNLGWRKAMYKYDRRKYDEIPVQWATELNLAPSEQWDRTLTAGTAAARGHGPLPPFRPQAGGWNAPDLNYLSDSDRMV